jgi:SAM-dependent methyltransferase
MRITRLRVHWMCREARDSPILDVGCSQGLATILLAREGHEVSGIDTQRASIEFACERLSKEERHVRDRVTFQVAEAQHLPFDDGSFGTVIMGEILEHLVEPAPILDEALRVLKPGGRLILTTPYGLFPSLDHKEPIYLRDIVTLLQGRFAIRELRLLDKFVGVVAVANPTAANDDAAFVSGALSVAEERLRFQDTALQALKENFKREAAEWAATRGQLQERIKTDAAAARERRADLERRVKALEAELWESERLLTDERRAREQKLEQLATALGAAESRSEAEKARAAALEQAAHVRAETEAALREERQALVVRMEELASRAEAVASTNQALETQVTDAASRIRDVHVRVEALTASMAPGGAFHESVTAEDEAIRAEARRAAESVRDELLPQVQSLADAMESAATSRDELAKRIRQLGKAVKAASAAQTTPAKPPVKPTTSNPTNRPDANSDERPTTPKGPTALDGQERLAPARARSRRRPRPERVPPPPRRVTE